MPRGFSITAAVYRGRTNFPKVKPLFHFFRSQTLNCRQILTGMTSPWLHTASAEMAQAETGPSTSSPDHPHAWKANAGRGLAAAGRGSGSRGPCFFSKRASALDAGCVPRTSVPRDPGRRGWALLCSILGNHPASFPLLLISGGSRKVPRRLKEDTDSTHEMVARLYYIMSGDERHSSILNCF